ncbi:MAG: serine/threonine-protein kinase [Gemmataceae bacterium]
MNQSATDPGPTPRYEIISNAELQEIARELQDARFDPNVDFIPEYEIYNLIGEGGYGQVYRARQTKLDRDVALKIIASDEISAAQSSKRFESEAHLLAKLHHPHIVQIYDFGRTKKFMYLAMELLEGEDLASRLHSAGKLGEWETWWIIRQAAAGLAHASAIGIVHRDIKPANLYCTKAPTGSHLPDRIPHVSVTDFGLALVKRNTADAANKTAHAAALGTPAYMAPEQHQSKEIDLRADIYALGATAYHTLSGKLPFQGGTIWDVIAKKMDRTPRSLPFGMEKSAQLISAMMEPKVDRRIQSYDALIQQIDELLAHSEKTQVKQETAAYWRRVRRIMMTGMMIVFAILSIVLIKTMMANRPIIIPVPPYHSVGIQESFFDGVSLNRWSSSGLNAVERDEEGSPILSVSGLIQHSLPETTDYRLTVGADIYQSKSLEIQLIDSAGNEQSRRLVIRISREEGAVFGMRTGKKGAFQPLGSSIAYPSENWLKDRRPYLEIRVEKIGAIWSVWFHGELLGRTVAITNSLNQLLILGENGRARLDTVVWERLVPDE